MVDISKTLAERGSRYGKFTDHSHYTQELKRIIASSSNWEFMAYDQREALEMIAHKIGRILSGDPNYADNWHDIVGYAKLVDDRLQGPQDPTPSTPHMRECHCYQCIPITVKP